MFTVLVENPFPEVSQVSQTGNVIESSVGSSVG